MNVKKWLKNYGSTGKDSTHVSMCTPKGCFKITGDSEETFMNEYCYFMSQNFNNTSSVLGLAEKPYAIEPTPLRVDVDMKLASLGDGDPLNMDVIEKVIELYRDIISEIESDESFDVKHQECILLLKDTKYRKKTEKGYEFWKTGFHLHFPFFVCLPFVQSQIIREKIIKKVGMAQLFSGIDFVKGEDRLENIFDKISLHPWLMYGSRKDANTEQWKISKCYDSTGDVMDLEDMFFDIIDDLKVKDYTYNLPFFLSIHGKSEYQITIKKEFHKLLTKKRSKNVVYIRSPEKIAEDLAFISNYNLIDMLSYARADNYKTWIEVGWVLYCVSDGRDEGLEFWKLFSQKSEKYDEDEVVSEWNKMESRGFTIGTLRMFAKQDSPEEYSKIRSYRITSDIEMVLAKMYGNPKTKPHKWIALMFKNMYPDEFVCTVSKSDVWYFFEGHKWRKADGDLEISSRVQNELLEQFENHKLYLEKKKNNLDDDDKDQEKRLINKIKLCTSIVVNLGTNAFSDQIVVACKKEYHNRCFVEMINEKKHLVGVMNGVFDLDLGIFRDGRPDDYISLNTNINFKRFSPGCKMEKRFYSFYTKIFNDKELGEYFLNVCASCFRGGNIRKLFVIMTGPEGNNGKTTFAKLLEIIFGEYFGKVEQEFVILGKSKSNAGGARPDIEHIIGKRLICIDELDKNVKVDIGVIKKYTSGGDSVWNRGLYKDGNKFTPQATFFCQCNDPPAIPAYDNAIWNRSKFIEFLATFTTDAPDDIEEQRKTRTFKPDKNIDKFLNELKEWLQYNFLMRAYNIGYGDIHEPKVVTDCVNYNKSQNDVHSNFILQNLTNTKDKADTLSLTALHSSFMQWFKETYVGMSLGELGDKIKFKNTMSSKRYLGVCSKKGIGFYWVGWQFTSCITQDMSDGEEDIQG